MCGIAGIFSLAHEVPDSSLLKAMADSLTHRGPDSEGVRVLDGLGFAHRRLSIIDQAGGAQPMSSSDGDLLLCYNGEIFNYLELKAELQNQGGIFRTTGDTEVILEAFRIWGRDSFQKFNGQFAFGLYQRSTKTLYLVRDRLGEKPLYFLRHNSLVVFASELKAIALWMNKQGVSSPLDRQALWNFLSLNYIPFSKTLLKDVHCLSPASVLEISPAGIKESKYWSPKVSSFAGSQTEAVDELQARMQQAIKIRLRSDVPLAIFLSSGIDSNIVAALALAQGAKVKAFCADIKGLSFSEAGAAGESARALGIDCDRISIDPSEKDLPSLISKLVFHADRPLADSSALAVYLLCEGVAKTHKVALSGDGGDELFAGYLTNRATLFAAKIPRLIRQCGPALTRILRLIPASSKKVGTQEKLDRFLSRMHLEPGAAHFAWNGMFSFSEKLELINRDFLPQEANLKDTFQELAEVYKVNLSRPELSQLLLADQSCYLTNDILAKTDSMSMAHGVEVRPAFLDASLLEFSRSVPDCWHVQGGSGKYLLKQVLQRVAPWYDLSRPKQGFSIPVNAWFRGALKDYVYSEVCEGPLVELGICSPGKLKSIFVQHQRARQNLGFELWGLLVLSLWLRNYRGVYTL